jgi:hypothetical protein
MAELRRHLHSPSIPRGVTPPDALGSLLASFGNQPRFERVNSTAQLILRLA